MTTKFEELLRYLLTELYTPKIGPGPIFGKKLPKIGPGPISGWAYSQKAPIYLRMFTRNQSN